jgi:hypothetical protein
MKTIKENRLGQGPIIIAIGELIIIAIAAGAILVGMSTLSVCEGNGLVDIGAGLALLGAGGVALVVRTPTALLAGAPGAVIIVIGAILAYLAHC